MRTQFAHLGAFALLAVLSTSCWEKKQTISGTVEILPQLQSRISETAALYVIARKPGERTGPPVAVKRYKYPFRFPLAFVIGEEDAMIPNTPFEGELALTARVSQSGAATPVNVGDLESPPEPPPVQVGAQDVKIEINLLKN